MIDDLEKFFGPGWLNKAVHPTGGVAGPTMGPYFASLAGVVAFRSVVGLWARLQYLVRAETVGIGILRRNLQANPVADELRHHTALARLAVQAHLVGARVTLEPKKPEGGPGDLRAVRAGSDVFIELRTLGPDKAFQRYHRNVDRAQACLRQLELQQDVHWHGELPREPTAEWIEAVTVAAAKAAATTTAVDVVHDGVVLTAQPGPAAVGTEIFGPTWESDQGPRLLRALVVKAVKTASAGAAWLCLKTPERCGRCPHSLKIPFRRRRKPCVTLSSRCSTPIRTSWASFSRRANSESAASMIAPTTSTTGARLSGAGYPTLR